MSPLTLSDQSDTNDEPITPEQWAIIDERLASFQKFKQTPQGAGVSTGALIKDLVRKTELDAALVRRIVDSRMRRDGVNSNVTMDEDEAGLMALLRATKGEIPYETLLGKLTGRVEIKRARRLAAGFCDRATKPVTPAEKNAAWAKVRRTLGPDALSS
jgi:hypothetical protein